MCPQDASFLLKQTHGVCEDYMLKTGLMGARGVMRRAPGAARRLTPGDR
jgi:hypothetical protein